MQLKLFKNKLSVCKLETLEEALHVEKDALYFLSVTDDEISLVCNTEQKPANPLSVEDCWRAIKIVGELDFSLVGILAKISTLLANAAVPIFAVSTYNTDYILVKEDKLTTALNTLTEAGYSFI